MEKDGVAEVVCTITECPTLTEHQDFDEYELEELYNPDKCCPEIVRKSCKHHGNVHPVSFHKKSDGVSFEKKKRFH